jgi:inosine-uridine nucleoside N-ribohydrolase
MIDAEQARALTAATDEEPEGSAPARLRRCGLGAALGAMLCAVLALVRLSLPAPAPRSLGQPRASLGLSGGVQPMSDGVEVETKACKKVYIDTDVGIDDNIALVASFGLHRQGKICIIGIGVTDGNIPAWISAYTFPRLLALFRMEGLPFSTPAVAADKSGDMGLLFHDMDGNYQPEGGRGSAEHIHGKAGMGGMAEFLSLDPKVSFPNQDADGNPGVFLEQRLEDECGNKDCDVLVLGPLTNVVAANKDILARHVNRVIWMGGSFVKPQRLSSNDVKGIDYVPLQRHDWNVGLRRRGNIAPLSEFNAWAGSEPLAQFLTERDESVGFDMIPLDVTSRLMWSPHLMNVFEQAAGVNDSDAWDSKKFRDNLMEFREEHPGVTEGNNNALGEEITTAFEAERAVRRESNFSYPCTRSGRASFIRDISVKGWASTVADGQMPKKVVANLAHDVAVLAYEMNSDLFDAGELEDVSVVVKGGATDKLWDQLDEEHAVERQFTNGQWGVEGAPIRDDLKGAVFEPSEAGDAQVMQDLAKEELSTDFALKTGKARVVKFAETPGEPNKAERQVMDWLANTLAQAIN